MNYIVDTSVVLQWFHQSGEVHVKEARRVLDDLRSGRIDIAIPDIVPLELLNAMVKGKGLSATDVNKTLQDLFAMPIRIIGISLPVLEKSFKLMKEYNVASYDAYFLALAQMESWTLISDDGKAHGQIKDGSVLMLEDYAT